MDTRYQHIDSIHSVPAKTLRRAPWWMTMSLALAALTPCLFLSLGISAYLLNEKPLSNYGSNVMRLTKLVSTETFPSQTSVKSYTQT